MEKQKLRSEIEEKYKWDLSSIYKNENDINEDVKEVKVLTEKLLNYENKKITTGEDLYEVLSLNFKIDEIIGKLSLYSSLKVSEDSSNSENKKLNGEIENLIVKIMTDLSFLTNKIYELEYDDVIRYYDEYPKLKEYEFHLKKLFEEKKHILSNKEEKILSSLSKSLSLSESAYSTFVNADIKFGNIGDKELTFSNLSTFLKSEDRKVRKEAFERFYGTFGKYTSTISELYNSHLETVTTLCNLKKYENVLSSTLTEDNLSESIVSNLIETVNDNLDVLHNYYKIKKDILKIDDYHIYDNSTIIVPKLDRKYTYEEAKDIILDVFKIYGDDYLAVLKKSFENRWIDVYNNSGKYPGAFSACVYGTNPFVLTNFEGEFDDISTLAHELGHSVNSYFTVNNNPIQYYDYTLFMAEMASLTNEIIFNKTMAEKENDPKFKLYILNNLIKIFASNLFDACLYAEFEYDVHNKVENGEVLTSDYFNNKCLELNKKYYGDNVIVDDDIKYRWEIYSHLYVDYYLYKYATGISVATVCASKILDGDKEFIDKYKEFLKVGSSKYSKDALKELGIDVTKKDFIINAIEFFDNLVKEFKEVYDSIK